MKYYENRKIEKEEFADLFEFKEEFSEDINEESEQKESPININLNKTNIIDLNLDKTNEVKDCLLVYNTDNYQSNNFSLQFIVFDGIKNEVIVNKEIFPDKALIWKYRDTYGLLDVYSATADIIEEIEYISSIFRKSPKNSLGIVKLYPDTDNKDCYIKMIMPLSTQLTSSVSRNTISKKILSQALIDANITIYINEVEIKDVNKSFEDITNKDIELSDEEKQFVQNQFNLQNDINWFNTNNNQKDKKEKLKEKPKKQTKNDDLNVQVCSDEIFDPSILKIISGSKNPMQDMEKIIGLDNIKHEIEKLKYTLEYKEERRRRGITDNSSSSMHMCFYGSPGTGKTTVARIMTGLLYNMGYIRKNQCIEINGLEFKGGYVGQTEIITKGILDYAKGGILFVDEAYALCSNLNDSYGQEAVNTFIKEMEDNRDDLVIIFAGYEKAMEAFLNMNTGFRSRINRYFKFEDYTTEQLIEIFIRQLRSKHLKIEKFALEKSMSFFKKAQNYNNFGNGRFVVNFIEKIEETHILNVENIDDIERIDTIKYEDIDNKICENLLISLRN